MAKDKKQPKAKSTIDPKIMQLGLQNYQSAQNVANQPFTPYTGQLTPGIPQATNDAVASAQRLTGFTPQQVTAPVAGAAKARAANVARTPDVTAQTGLAGMDAYMNPYTQQVIDANISDLDRARQIAQVGNAQQSTMGGGAFGGSRLGVQEGETNRGYLNAVANMSANLRNQGFNTSAGLMQSDYDRALAAAQGNQGVAAGRASQVGAQQQQTNLANAGFGQQAGLANQQANLQSQLANQNAGLAGANLNLGATQTLGGLGAQQYGMGLDATQAAYQDWLRGQNLPYLNQQMLNQSLGGLAGLSGTQQYVQPNTPFLNFLGQGVGGLAQGLGFGLMQPKPQLY